MILAAWEKELLAAGIDPEFLGEAVAKLRRKLGGPAGIAIDPKSNKQNRKPPKAPPPPEFKPRSSSPPTFTTERRPWETWIATPEERLSLASKGPPKPRKRKPAAQRPGRVRLIITVG